jgi:hypothetical protein
VKSLGQQHLMRVRDDEVLEHDHDQPESSRDIRDRHQARAPQTPHLALRLQYWKPADRLTGGARAVRVLSAVELSWAASRLVDRAVPGCFEEQC